MGLEKLDTKTYASIIGGSIRVKTDENDPEAVKREYELKDGTKGTKYELKYGSLSGKIKNVEFRDGEYGMELLITVAEQGKDDIVLAINTTQNYSDDFLKKLPNINLDEDVVLKPYDFVDQMNKKRKGLSIQQSEGKIENFFYNPDSKETCHGYPEFPENYKDMDSDDWKVYFINIRKFLKKYTEENVLHKFVKDEDLPEENADDIDFGENQEDSKE